MKISLIHFVFLLSLIPITASYAQNKQSILLNDSNSIREVDQKEKVVDFFELSKKYQIPESKPNWENASNTVNMSKFEREQYLFNQRQYSTLNSELNQKKIDSLKKSRDEGQISNKQYQQQLNLIKMQNAPNKPESMGFTIPFGED